MRILSRYVFRQSAGALSLILGSLSGIVWIGLALKELNVVTSKGQDAIMLVKITSLALPNLVAIIAPVALLIATMHTLNRLGGDSELIVLTASGATTWTLARPLVALAVIVSLGVAFINHVGQPWSLQTLRGYIVEMRADLLSKVIQPGRFSSPENNLTFHIRERELNGDLRGLLVDDRRQAKEARTYLADKATIVKQGEQVYLVMSDGHILRRPASEAAAQIIVFDNYIADLDDFEKRAVGGPIQFKPRELYTQGLIRPDKSNFYYTRYPGQFRSELHERFSSPLYPIAFVLIALAAVGQARSTREHRNEVLVVGFAAAIGIRLAGFAVNTLVTKSGAFVVLLYALPIGASLLALVMIKRGARPHRSLSLTDLLDERFGWLKRRLPPFGRRDGNPAALDAG